MNYESGFELFSTLITKAAKSMQKIKSKKMIEFGLGSIHTTCIRMLYSHPEGLTRSALSQQCMVDKAHIFRITSDLLDKGYVTRDDEAGKYKCVFRLTSSGKEAAQQIDGIVREIISYVSGSIPPSELKIFYSTLGTICDRLKKAESQF